jgi:membrane-associated phospholipid phosphatase
MSNKVYEYLISNLRAFPCTITVFNIIAGLLFNNPTYLFFGIYVFICDCIAALMKKGTKNLYKLFNTDYLPILGYGTRPKGATYCGCFITESNLKGITTSYGMPSGHSIMAGITFIFWYYYLMDNTKDEKKRRRQIILLAIICGAVMFSRIYLKCHTIQHVIVGAAIGFGFGHIGYHYFYKEYMQFLKNQDFISLNQNDNDTNA